MYYPRRQKPSKSCQLKLDKLILRKLKLNHSVKPNNQLKLGQLSKHKLNATRFYCQPKLSNHEEIYMMNTNIKIGEQQSHQIIIDSGASSITVNRTWLEYIQDLKPSQESVLTASGVINNMIMGQGYINILGIRFMCKYAPTIHKSVISVGILAQHGIMSVFYPDGRLELSVGGKEYCIRMSQNHMYHLPNEWIQNKEHEIAKTTSEVFIADAHVADKRRLWHARLGHSNVERIKRMSENPLYQARGIHITPTELVKYKEDFCTACAMGKSIATPAIRGDDLVVEPEIGEKFHVDFTGPNPTESIHGFLYSVIIADEATGHIWQYCLKHKDTPSTLAVLEKFESSIVENNHVKPARVYMMSDNGEFTSAQVTYACRQAGIMQLFTPPYRSETNGFVETRIRMVKQMSKTLLYAAKLSEPFWEYADKYAAFLINILPSCKEAKKGSDPYTKWTGRTYNYRRLRIWGCEAIVHIPHPIKNRLPTGIKGIFVGVSGITYDIYIPEKGTIMSSADVTFHEQIENEDILQKRLTPEIIEHASESTEYELSQFEKYRNTTHYDHEDKLYFKVIDIRIQKGQIVADRIKISNNPKGHQNGRNKDTILAAHLHTYDIQENKSDDKKRHINTLTSIENKKKARPNTITTSFKEQISSEAMSSGTQISRPRRSDRLSISNLLVCEFEETIESQNISSTLTSILNEPNCAEKRIPLCHKHVMTSLNKEHWLDAERKEMTGLWDVGAWIWAKCPDDVRPIMSKWTYAIKTNAEGVIQRFKARICARGDQTKEGIDYEETFSPVVKWESIRLFLALTVLLRLSPLQLDVDLAYLYAPLEETIYMKPPDGVESPPGMVFRLIKSLYGLPQSGRNWNSHLHDTLIVAKFVRLQEDTCLYIRKQQDKITILAVYVDDLYIAASNGEILNTLIEWLQTVYKIKILGIPKQLLGVRITWSPSFDKVSVTIPKMIIKLSQDYNQIDKEANIPISPGHNLSKEQCPTPLQQQEAYIKWMQKMYRTLVGSFIWICHTCRPDIAYATMILCRFMSNPGEPHWKVSIQTLRYLNKTKYWGIQYSHDGNRIPYGFCDADFSADESRKSVGSFVFMLADGPFSWKTALDRKIALSTCEAETRAVHAARETIKEAIWLAKLFEELNIPNIGSSNNFPIKIHEDNLSTIMYSKNPAHHSTMKHLERELYWIRENVQQGTIILEATATEDQCADMLTKALHTPQLTKLRGKIMVEDIIAEVITNVTVGGSIKHIKEQKSSK